MRRLTTKQQFALVFSIYVFLLLVILSGLFLIIFHFAVDYQLKRGLTNEATEIINTHLMLDKDTIVFVRDDTGSSLKEYLLQNDTTAVFLDKEKNIVRSYSLFALENKNESEDKLQFQKLTDPIFQGKNTFETSINWVGQQLTILTVPIKNHGNILGAMVLGKSLGSIETLSRLMVAVLAGLGFLNLVGSFVLGYFLAKKSLNPLRKMIDVVDQVDLDRLDNLIKIGGHPEDEFVILAGRFNEMITRLKENALRQKEFIANASHELKTPLTRAITSLDILASTSLTDNEKQKEIELVKQDLFNINNLLEKLLLLSKLKKDDHLLATKQMVEFENIYKKLQRRFQFQLEDKKIKLKGQFPKTIQISLPIEYLEIILSNLVGNAIKYSRQKTEIMIIVESVDNKTTIEVEDQGIGMERQDIFRVFDRFFRTRSREKGYGIGLSIVKQLCELYNIGIEVQSETNKGTSVKLTLSS